MNPRLRADFPLLERTLDGKPLVYLDSAATALKPRAVVDAEVEYLTRYTANVHRGKHALSEEASQAFESARRRLARFVNVDPQQVVFTRNTTEALNLVAHGLRLGRDDVVLAPVGEHHSNLLPWMSRAKVIVLDADPCAPLEPEALARAVEQHRPKVVALAHASNVTGVVHPVAELAKVARERGALVVVDAAQSAPHLRLDLEALGCDFLAFSGHKMLGPTGVGLLCGRLEALERLEPLALGGGTVQRVTAQGYTLKGVPHRLEAGTPNIAGVIALAAAADYLEEVGWEALDAHEAALADALDRALEELPGARRIMARAAPRLALACVAPLSEKLSPDHLAITLSDHYQVMVRSGHHCAHPLFDKLGLPQGALRASAYLYNTVEEIEGFGRAVREVLAKMVGGARK